jgi:hypothetical protein
LAIRRNPRAAAYVASIALHLLLAPFLIHDWDGYVFIQSARDFVHGITPYERAEAGGANIFLGYDLPVVNSWYAYPPMILLIITPFFAILTSFSTAPGVERLAIKIPFILGDLLLALAARELVLHEVEKKDILRAEDWANWVERILLLNPFLIFISGIWGMFDAWMFVFFFAAILFVSKGQPFLGGASFALAVLVKPFPALVAPFFLAWVFWSRPAREFWATVAGGGIATVLVCLPFYLQAPQGFLQLVLFNHATRAPQGLGFIVLLDGLSYINTLWGLNVPFLQSEALSVVLSNVSFALLALLLAILYLRGWRIRSVEELLRFSLVALVGFLLVGKVVNEQYFEMPLILGFATYAIAARGTCAGFWKRLASGMPGGDRGWSRIRNALVSPLVGSREELPWNLALAFTGGGFVVAVFEGYHFLTFVPPDVAVRLTSIPQQAWLPDLRDLLHANDTFMALFPEVLSLVSLIPALLLSLRYVFPELTAPFQSLARRASAPRIRGRPRLVAGFAVVLLLSGSVFAGIAAPSSVQATSIPMPPLAKTGPLVGVVYNLGWNNPAHDTTLLYGTWETGVTETPLDGYYTMSAGKMDEDFAAMQEHGIDLVVFRYQPADPALYLALSTLAYHHDLLVAPYIDMATLRQDPRCQILLSNDTKEGPAGPVSLRMECQNLITSEISDSIRVLQGAPSQWRFAGRPVVLVGNSTFVGIDGTGEVRTRIEHLALEIAWSEHNVTEAEPATMSLLDANYPAEPGALAGAGDWSGLYRRAFAAAEQGFWAHIRSTVEAQVGPLFWVAGANVNPSLGLDGGLASTFLTAGTFNDTALLSPTDGWSADSQGPGNSSLVSAMKTVEELVAGRPGPLILSVSPGVDPAPWTGEPARIPYLEGGNLTYEQEWRTVARERPDVLLVQSWNDFQLGDGIEPTTQFGGQFLSETATLAPSLRNETPRASTPSVLVLTNDVGASLLQRVPDPDWTARLTGELAADANSRFLGNVSLRDVNTVDPGSISWSSEGLVVVEPGPSFISSPYRTQLSEALLQYVLRGGRVLLFGGYSDPTFSNLASWNESGTANETLLELPAGNLSIPHTDRVVNETPPPSATVLLWMKEGQRGLPALWTEPRGRGHVYVTAFKPEDVPGTSAFDAVVNATSEASR